MRSLESIEVRGRSLRCAEVQQKSFENNRRPQENKRQVDESKPPAERIADQVTPLWRLPYSDQLVEKETHFRKVLAKMKRKLFDFFPKGKKSSTKEPAPETESTVPLTEAQPQEDPNEKIFRELAWIREA